MKNKNLLWSMGDTLMLIYVIFIIAGFILIHIAPECSINWAVKINRNIDVSKLVTYKYISIILTALMLNFIGAIGIFCNYKFKDWFYFSLQNFHLNLLKKYFTVKVWSKMIIW